MKLGTENDVVDVLEYRTPDGRTLLTVRATRVNRRWLRSFFCGDLTPFKTLRDMGFWLVQEPEKAKKAKKAKKPLNKKPVATKSPPA
jgi:hypothetical protein